MNNHLQKISIWVINLPDNTERMQRMQTQLQRMGLVWQHFPAVDGRKEYARLLPQADEQAYARNMGSPLLPGKLGVFASHTSVWRQFLDSDHELALIFEDDVVFHDDFLEALQAACEVSHHWDIVRFNCVRAKLPITQGIVGRWRLNAYAGPFTGNAAYLIHRKTAEKLLQQVWPQTRALDHELNRFFHHHYRLLGLEPWASHTDDGNVSTITGVGFASVKKFKWYKRLPHYRLKAANYFRRVAWLIGKGMIWPSNRDLSKF